MLILITPYEAPDEPLDPLLEEVYQDDPTPEEETQQ
jgi:hypothetical protein